MRDTPVTYVAFDLLYLDGHSTLSLAYEQRRELLEELELEGPAWRAPAYHRGEGKALLDATRELGIEGIVAKRLDSTYEPGRRTSAWLKIKNVCEQDVVIGGWTPGEGGRSATLGALAVGVMRRRRADATPARSARASPSRRSRLLQRELEPLRRDSSPFDGPPAAEGHGLRGAAAGRARRVARMDAQRNDESALFQGSKRRRGPAGLHS